MLILHCEWYGFVDHKKTIISCFDLPNQHCEGEETKDTIVYRARCFISFCYDYWSGLIWSDLVWSGLVWSGLVWSGLVWSGLAIQLLNKQQLNTERCHGQKNHTE